MILGFKHFTMHTSSWWYAYQIWNKIDKKIHFAWIVWFDDMKINIHDITIKKLNYFLWIEKYIFSNFNLEINIVWGLKFKNSINLVIPLGKIIYMLGGWPWHQWRTLNGMVNHLSKHHYDVDFAHSPQKYTSLIQKEPPTMRLEGSTPKLETTMWSQIYKLAELIKEQVGIEPPIYHVFGHHTFGEGRGFVALK